MSAIKKLERQCLTLAEEIDALRASEAKLRKALDNCMLLAMKRLAYRNRPPIFDDWETVLRFCKEGGVEPSPLRAADEV